MHMKRLVPWMMAVGRAALGPVLVVGERCRWNGLALAAMVMAALLSDIFDGVLARRWKTDTSALRLFDSMADTMFYGCVAAAVWVGMPGIWTAYRGAVLLLLACEAARLVFDVCKFGKPASYHSYLAKIWGLVLAVAVIATFWTQRVSGWMSAAAVLGLLCNAESLMMSIVLPVWRRDVKTLALAWRLRVALRATERVKLSAACMLLLAGGVATHANAQQLSDVKYVGGTNASLTGAHGALRITSANELVLESPARLTIPYENVLSYESSSRDRVHVGLLTEGLWRLVFPWPEAKQLTLSYTDENNQKQVAVLEMSRGDEAVLVEVLKTRVPPCSERTNCIARPPLRPVAGAAK